MGERKGQLKWYPPDFDPRKHKSLDAYYGTHPLRERAKKLDKGILVIRFEMPYDIWCGGCGIHIAQSVRYNAEKSKAGMYYTTPIWKFRMRCHLCPQYFEIKTDPANHDYVIISGARRKEKRWDPKENEQIVPDDKSDIKKMNTDAMFKLEHGTDDKQKLKAKIPGLAEIEGAQSKWRDDDLLNSQARSMFRSEKKQIKAETESDAHLLKKSSLDIALVKEHTDDIHMASLLQYTSGKTYDEKQAEKRHEISTRCIFAPDATTQQPQQLALTSHSDAPDSNADRAQSADSNAVALISGSVSHGLTPTMEKQLKVASTKKKLGIKPVTSAFSLAKQREHTPVKKSFNAALRKGMLVKKASTSRSDDGRCVPNSVPNSDDGNVRSGRDATPTTVTDNVTHKVDPPIDTPATVCTEVVTSSVSSTGCQNEAVTSSASSTGSQNEAVTSSADSTSSLNEAVTVSAGLGRLMASYDASDSNSDSDSGG